jgi:hypothetical protein
VGTDILRTHRWPTNDTYSFTVRGNEWIAYEWLAEVIMAQVNRLGGLAGLMLLLAGLGSVLGLLLYYYACLRCANPKAAFVAAMPLLVFVAGFLRLRPQLLGYIFLLTTLICLEHFRRGRPKALWILPGVFLLWVNTHPTFSLGLLVVALTWASGLVEFRHGGLEAHRWTARERRHLETALLLCVLVLPLTPYGTRLVGYWLDAAVFQTVSVANISEWQPLGAFPGLLKLFLAFLLSFLMALVLLRPTYRLQEVVLFLLAVCFSFVHTRFLLLFPLVCAPMLAALLTRWVAPYHGSKDRHGLNAAIILVLAALVLRSFPSQRDLQRLVASKVPGEAVEYLKRHPLNGSILNDYNYGGYLIWSLGSTHRVFIDGRADAYEPAGVLSDYLDITRLKPDALLLLRKYGIEACLIARGAALATLLAALPEWERVHEDPVAVIFVRKRAALTTATGHRETMSAKF